MCGIAGIISADPSVVSVEKLKQMTDALIHRGPDDGGQWVSPSGIAGLGNRRLAIIDLSEAGRQPMHYLDRYHITHNGEIYNFPELKSHLEKKGYSFFSGTDTEVIAAAYDAYGEVCVDQFDGMFAFAIWDEKEKNLFAARDRFGEKPFFYSYTDKTLVFASEMKALWAAGIPAEPNLKMLFNFLTIGYTGNPVRPEETFFENIFKLPAACFLNYDPVKDKLVIEKYWDIENIGEARINDQEAIGKFADLLKQSVKRRWHSDVPAGTCLSGGLDSSSIVAISHVLHPASNSHKCFTASFPGFEKDETAYAKSVAEQYQLQHYTVSVHPGEMIRDWEKLVFYQEEPFTSSSIYAQYKVYELAAQQNVTVLLDGQGADETLAGYHRYYRWYWQELFRKRKLLSSGELKAARNIGIKEKFGARNILASLFPEFASVFLEQRYLLHALQQEDLTRDFVKYQSKEAYYTTPPIGTLNGRLYFNTCVHGLEELLRYADRNSMAHGREVRLPFLDHQLVEFIFSLPSSFKIREGWTKWLLRKSMEPVLPGAITWRKDKTAYEPPQHLWMQDEKVQELITAAKEKLVKEKILKPGVPEKKIQPHDAYTPGNDDWRYLSAAVLFK